MFVMSFCAQRWCDIYMCACACRSELFLHRPKANTTNTDTKQVTGRLALVELAFTFALCFAVLHTTLPPTQQPNR